MKKILIIEDEYSLRSSVRDILEGNNYKVFTAADGREGIDLAKEFQPDLIVCDIMMPGIDGYGVMSELNKDSATSSIPFIYLTAKAEMAELRRGMDSGADDYLIKPIRAAELINAIELRLQKFEALKEKFGGKEIAENEEDAKRKHTENDRIFLMVKNKPQFVRLGDMICISADGEYSTVCLDDGSKILVRKLLKQWDEILPENIFLRIHRSTIINLNFVDKVEKWYKRSYIVYLKKLEQSFTISQRYAAKIKSHLLS